MTPLSFPNVTAATARAAQARTLRERHVSPEPGCGPLCGGMRVPTMLLIATAGLVAAQQPEGKIHSWIDREIHKLSLLQQFD